MTDTRASVPVPVNEPVRGYAPGSPERAALTSALESMMSSEVEIPLRIGGDKVTTGRVGDCQAPHDHGHLLGRYHKASAEQVSQAIEAARNAHADWSRMPWQSRAAVFLKAADLLATTYRDALNGSTMLGQSKTVFQAEIDAACELIDFFRYNTHYLQQIYGQFKLGSLVQKTAQDGICSILNYQCY